MNINQQCRRALAVGLAAMLIPVMGGCGRSARQTAAPRTNESAEQKSSAAELAQAEKEMQDSRKRAGAELSAVLDKRFGYWKLEWLKEVDGTRFVTVDTEPGEMQACRFVAVAPDNRILMNVQVGGSTFADFEGLYDIDGDGHKEAFISIFNGGNSGLDDCVFFRLRPKASLMGGNDMCPSGCVKAADIDGDGRTEFEVLDIAAIGYETYKHADPDLPVVFGYRGGRFQDLTSSIARDKLRQRIARARRNLSRPGRSDQPGEVSPWMETIAWYLAARLLGRTEAEALREMEPVIGKQKVEKFMPHLGPMQEMLDTRKTRFWTGPEESPWGSDDKDTG